MWHVLSLLLWLWGPVASAADQESVIYRVDPRDTIQIDVFGVPELSGSFEVSETGTIDVPLLRQISVAGKTTGEIAEQLEQAFGADYLIEPHINVRVETFGSKPIQVLGAVKTPGVYYLTGPTTLLEILAKSGGINNDRSIKEVRISRGDAPAITIKLDELLTAGKDNLMLQANDVVHVPEGQVVYVAGQVEKPGEVFFTEGLTASQAIALAGGWKATARLKYAYILRNGTRTRINLRRIMKGKEADIRLLAGDQLYIEESVF